MKVMKINQNKLIYNNIEMFKNKIDSKNVQFIPKKNDDAKKVLNTKNL